MIWEVCTILILKMFLKLYNDVKNKYNILYSELKIEKNEKLTGFIVLVLVATLVFNIVNFIMSMK